MFVARIPSGFAAHAADETGGLARAFVFDRIGRRENTVSRFSIVPELMAVYGMKRC